MDETQPAGGAGPALASHSKDSKAAGQTAFPRETRGPTLTGERARESLAQQIGPATEWAEEWVRQQPIRALALSGAVCFALGLMLRRR